MKEIASESEKERERKKEKEVCQRVIAFAVQEFVSKSLCQDFGKKLLSV